MPEYVDGFVMVVPKRNMPAYKKMAAQAGKIWREHGALEYRECVGEDMKAEHGLPFPKLTGMKANETVVFAWIVYKSKRDRDRINKKVMADPRLKCPDPMPFDMKRMSYGGFDVIVKAK